MENGIDVPIKRFRNGKRVTAFLLVLAVIFLVFRFVYPSVGFVYYQPTYLPPNVTIHARRLNPASKYISASIEQDFATNDWVYEISESSDTRTAAAVTTSNQGYSATSIKPTCSTFPVTYVSDHSKGIYRLCHWVDYGRTNVYETTMLHGNTLIYSNIPTPLAKPLTVAEVTKYVSSFKKHTTIGIPVDRDQTGP